MGLQRYKQYTREEVHDIFEPQTKFVSGTGSWGLQGIVKIRNTDDYVFFISIGSKQGTHIFVEGITKKGVLNWQSQPKQSLSSPLIHKLIQHNSLSHNIYLFFSFSQKSKNIYLSRHIVLYYTR